MRACSVCSRWAVSTGSSLEAMILCTPARCPEKSATRCHAMPVARCSRGTYCVSGFVRNHAPAANTHTSAPAASHTLTASRQAASAIVCSSTSLPEASSIAPPLKPARGVSSPSGPRSESSPCGGRLLTGRELHARRAQPPDGRDRRRRDTLVVPQQRAVDVADDEADHAATVRCCCSPRPSMPRRITSPGLQEHRVRLLAHAHAGRRAGGDDVARLQRHEVADVATPACATPKIIVCVLPFWKRWPLTSSHMREVLRVGDLVGRHQPRADRAEGVAALALVPGAAALELELALATRR